MIQSVRGAHSDDGFESVKFCCKIVKIQLRVEHKVLSGLLMCNAHQDSSGNYAASGSPILYLFCGFNISSTLSLAAQF